MRAQFFLWGLFFIGAIAMLFSSWWYIPVVMVVLEWGLFFIAGAVRGPDWRLVLHYAPFAAYCISYGIVQSVGFLHTLTYLHIPQKNPEEDSFP